MSVVITLNDAGHNNELYNCINDTKTAMFLSNRCALGEVNATISGTTATFRSKCALRQGI